MTGEGIEPADIGGDDGRHMPSHQVCCSRDRGNNKERMKEGESMNKSEKIKMKQTRNIDILGRGTRVPRAERDRT